MPKVWAFGCSHTEGAELGVGEFIDVDKWKGSIDDWNNELDQLYKTTNLNTRERELSYSGQLAKMLGYDLCNCGIRGSGADRVLHELLFDKGKHIDWNNDIVLVGYTHIFRYITDESKYDGNKNLNFIKDKKSKKFTKDMMLQGPSNFFWSASNAGIYHMIKTHFPKVLMIDTVNTTNTFAPGSLLKSITFNDRNLESFAKHKNDKYPLQHFKEYTHRELAQHIYEKILNDS